MKSVAFAARSSSLRQPHVINHRALLTRTRFKTRLHRLGVEERDYHDANMYERAFEPHQRTQLAEITFEKKGTLSDTRNRFVSGEGGYFFSYLVTRLHRSVDADQENFHLERVSSLI